MTLPLSSPYRDLAVKRKRNIDYIFISLQLILNVGDDGNYGSL